jgi:hypothetical protein
MPVKASHTKQTAKETRRYDLHLLLRRYDLHLLLNCVPLVSRNRCPSVTALTLWKNVERRIVQNSLVLSDSLCTHHQPYLYTAV